MVKFLLSLTKPQSLIVLLVVAVAVAGANWYLYNSSRKELSQLKTNPQAVASEETRKLVSQVGQLVALPEGENPTVATITDKEKLKNQVFFAKAENGDKVLLYTKARKAYLYSVSQNKILEVAPVNIGNTTQGQVAGERATPTPAPKK